MDTVTNIVRLTSERITEFKEYFKKYSHEQDESNPPLENYAVNKNEPAYLLITNDDITGAATLMLTPEYREAKMARFRMFHSADGKIESYKLLLNGILQDVKGLNSIYCFIEDKYSNIASIWEEIGFSSRRFAWVLEKKIDTLIKPVFPSGFELRTFRDEIDEDNWCTVINDAFEHSLGHVRMTPERIRQWRIDPSYLTGGMKILWHNDKPVGTVAMIKENHDNETAIFIEAIGVLHEYQGRGLGRNLLRAGLEFAVNYGVAKAMLSVNGENEKAADLYYKEGFKKEALYKCYYYDIKN